MYRLDGKKGRTMDDTKIDKIISQGKADTAFETFKAALIKQALIDNVNPIPIYLDTINRAFSVEAQEAFATDWLMAKEKYEKINKN